jgi:ABC-type sugar transport system substrate-binding protein
MLEFFTNTGGIITRKVLYLILVTFFISCLITGCTTENTKVTNPQTKKSGLPSKSVKTTSKDQKKQPLIACIVNQDDQYMNLLQLGMADAAEKSGANVIMANTYGKLDKEIELINTYIKSGVDGICIHPVSVDLSIPILKKAQENGIKVISAGIGIGDQYRIPYIESDQWELGKKTGEACREFIAKNLNGKANIAILNYNSQFPEESFKRTEGFKSEVTKLPGVKIIAEQEAWLSEMAISQASNSMSSQPDLNIFWAANEGGTVGAAIAVKNAGKSGRVFVFGTDVSEQLLNMILNEDKILQAVTGQQPYEIGYQSLNQLIDDINGEPTKAKIIIPGIPLSRNNMVDVKKYIEDFKKMIGAK